MEEPKEPKITEIEEHDKDLLCREIYKVIDKADNPIGAIIFDTKEAYSNYHKGTMMNDINNIFNKYLQADGVREKVLKDVEISSQLRNIHDLLVTYEESPDWAVGYDIQLSYRIRMDIQQLIRHLNEAINPDYKCPICNEPLAHIRDVKINNPSKFVGQNVDAIMCPKCKRMMSFSYNVLMSDDVYKFKDYIDQNRKMFISIVEDEKEGKE